MPLDFGGLEQAVNTLNAVLGKLEAAIAKVMQAAPGGGGAGTLAGQTNEASGGLTKFSFAVNQISGAFGVLTGLVSKFVGALDPALMEQLSWAVSNVVAVIGTALRPVAMVLVDVFRQLAAVLYPIMQALAPVLGELASILAELIPPVVEVFTTLFEALQPLIPVIIQVARIVTVVVAAVAKFFSVIVEMVGVLAETLGVFDLLADIMNALASVVKTVIRALAMMVATIAKFFGGEEFVRAMAARFKGRAPAPGQAPVAAAAQGHQISSVLDMLRAQQISAAKAMAGMSPVATKTTENFLADIGKELEGLANHGETFLSMVEKMLAAILQAIKDLMSAPQQIRGGIGNMGQAAGMSQEELEAAKAAANRVKGMVPGGAFLPNFF